MSKKSIFLIAGARPNFMKIAPLWHAFQGPQEYEVQIVHTGQHYDYQMSQVFFEELELPKPHYFLAVGSGSHGEQTGEVLKATEELFTQNPPDLVIVVGDVNSTLAAALSAAKLQVMVAHVEAGLRSFDRTMPEEINRVLTDRISDLLLVSEPSGVDNLGAEGVDLSRVHLVGNLMIDSLKRNLPMIRKRRTAQKLTLKEGGFGLVTLHRPANVDNERSLRRAIEILREAAARLPLVFPAHPRTRKNVSRFGLDGDMAAIENLQVIDPLGYFDFVHLMDASAFVLTDSGGIQEETTWLGVPCITLRENTERPLTVQTGTNTITGLEPEKVRSALREAENFNREQYKPPHLWDGMAAQRVLDRVGQSLQ